jgi:hypothetical protein
MPPRRSTLSSVYPKPARYMICLYNALFVVGPSKPYRCSGSRRPLRRMTRATRRLSPLYPRCNASPTINRLTTTRILSDVTPFLPADNLSLEGFFFILYILDPGCCMRSLHYAACIRIISCLEIEYKYILVVLVESRRCDKVDRMLYLDAVIAMADNMSNTSTRARLTRNSGILGH